MLLSIVNTHLCCAAVLPVFFTHHLRDHVVRWPLPSNIIINEKHFATEFRKIQHIAGLFKKDAYRLFEL
jgi:hypothetical protein